MPAPCWRKAKLKRGTRRFNELVSYRDDVQANAYAQAMRTWLDFPADGVKDHVIRYLRAITRCSPG